MLSGTLTQFSSKVYLHQGDRVGYILQEHLFLASSAIQRGSVLINNEYLGNLTLALLWAAGQVSACRNSALSARPPDASRAGAPAARWPATLRNCQRRLHPRLCPLLIAHTTEVHHVCAWLGRAKSAAAVSQWRRSSSPHSWDVLIRFWHSVSDKSINTN